MLIPLWRYIYIILQRWKVIKKSENSRKLGFSSLFACWWKDREPDPFKQITDPGSDPGGPKTFGSYGSRTLILLKTFKSWKYCFIWTVLFLTMFWLQVFKRLIWPDIYFMVNLYLESSYHSSQRDGLLVLDIGVESGPQSLGSFCRRIKIQTQAPRRINYTGASSLLISAVSGESRDASRIMYIFHQFTTALKLIKLILLLLILALVTWLQSSSQQTQQRKKVSKIFLPWQACFRKKTFIQPIPWLNKEPIGCTVWFRKKCNFHEYCTRRSCYKPETSHLAFYSMRTRCNTWYLCGHIPQALSLLFLCWVVRQVKGREEQLISRSRSDTSCASSSRSWWLATAGRSCWWSPDTEKYWVNFWTTAVPPLLTQLEACHSWPQLLVVVSHRKRLGQYLDISCSSFPRAAGGFPQLGAAAGGHLTQKKTGFLDNSCSSPPRASGHTRHQLLLLVAQLVAGWSCWWSPDQWITGTS